MNERHEREKSMDVVKNDRGPGCKAPVNWEYASSFDEFPGYVCPEPPHDPGEEFVEGRAVKRVTIVKESWPSCVSFR